MLVALLEQEPATGVDQEDAGEAPLAEHRRRAGDPLLEQWRDVVSRRHQLDPGQVSGVPEHHLGSLVALHVLLPEVGARDEELPTPPGAVRVDLLLLAEAGQVAGDQTYAGLLRQLARGALD